MVVPDSVYFCLLCQINVQCLVAVIIKVNFILKLKSSHRKQMRKNEKYESYGFLYCQICLNILKSCGCRKHFNPHCEWVTVRGGRRPNEPPSIFDEIPKSCLKQVKEKQRRTKLSSSEARAKT